LVLYRLQQLGGGIREPRVLRVLLPALFLKVLLHSLLYLWHLQQLVTVRSVCSVDLEHCLDNYAHVHGVVGRNCGVLALKHFLEEPVHVVSSEGRHQSAHLVHYAAQGPDITLVVVRLVLPHLWGSVVRCSRLGVEQTFLRYLAHIKVS